MLSLFIVMMVLQIAHSLKGPCSIDAALTWVGNDRMYLFKGTKYAIWNDVENQLGVIKPIKDNWKGIPNDIDAATTWGGRNYFFKGCQYWRYHADESSDGPHPISAWKLPCNIDAAAVWEGKTYFFKGDQYWRWIGDEYSGPSKVSAWKDLTGNLDAGVTWAENGKTYFLKGNKYWRYDGNDVTISNVAEGWPGVRDGDLLPDCQCDCNSCCNKNWEIDNIQYDTKLGKVVKLPPEVVATQVINGRNAGSTEGKIAFVAEKTVTETKSFTHTAGVSVTVGTTFKAGVPLIAEAGISVEVSASYSFEYGKQSTVEKKVSGTFECPGVTGKVITCKAMIHGNKADIPYTMTMKHKKRGCKCSSKGIYTQVSSYSLNLVMGEKDKK